MTGTHKPGTVAMVTMRRPKSWGGDGIHDGPPTYLAFYEGYEGRWITAEEGALSREGDSWKYEVRPLVVLDFGDWTPDCPRLVSEWIAQKASAIDCPSTSAALMVAQEIAAQTAPPKPPRIPEPGQWAVVEALIGGEVFTFVNRGSGWVCVDDGALWEWDRLIDPVLIRDGVPS